MLKISAVNSHASFNLLLKGITSSLNSTSRGFTSIKTSFSRFKDPIINPAIIAIAKPTNTYSKAIFQPNSENKSAITTASLSGAEIKYEKVTPKGILACRKPKKSGIALHEQKGVITPKIAAKICPVILFLPLIKARAFSTGK